MTKWQDFKARLWCAYHCMKGRQVMCNINLVVDKGATISVNKMVYTYNNIANAGEVMIAIPDNFKDTAAL